MLIPRIQTGQYNRNLTEYVITVKDWVLSNTDTPDVVATTRILFQTQDLTAPEPASPFVAQDLSSSCYYVYTYQHFIKLVNAALADATGELKRQYQILVPSPATPSLTDYYMQYFVGPHLDYGTSSNRIVLHVDEGVIQKTRRPLEIYFNEALYNLFSGLPAIYASRTGNMNYKLQILDYWYIPRKISIINWNGLAEATITMLQVYEESCSTAMWNPVSSIVFATSLLPIIPSQTSATRQLGGGSLVSGGNNANVLSILSDFSIAVDANNEYRPSILYNPGAEYRLIDMNSVMNLNKIDIIVFWKDVFGIMHPLELLPGCSAHVKILFRKKEFNNIG